MAHRTEGELLEVYTANHPKMQQGRSGFQRLAGIRAYASSNDSIHVVVTRSHRKDVRMVNNPEKRLCIGSGG